MIGRLRTDLARGSTRRSTEAQNIDVHGHFTAAGKVRSPAQDGTEFWSARDLMGPLGYTNWRQFATAIERAMSPAEAQNVDVTSLFAASGKKSTGGRPQQDFKLTRLAAYLVAMNGDPCIIAG